MPAMPADSLVWRMPPMDMSMPMMPGLESAVPPAAPALPPQHTMGLPMARPSEVVPLADGDTLHLEATLVRRQIGEDSFVMYGYNEQYPGPLLQVPPAERPLWLSSTTTSQSPPPCTGTAFVWITVLTGWPA